MIVVMEAEMAVKAEMAAGDAVDLRMKQTGRAHSILYHLNTGWLRIT